MINANTPVALRLKELNFRYHPNSAWIFEQLSFNLAEGESLALLGANGAGKSTLLNLINGLLPNLTASTYQGQIFLFEQEFTAKTQKKLQPLMGYCFQDPDDQLFCLTVREDLCFGPEQLGWSLERIEKKCTELIKLFRLETLIDKPVHAISGGEKRRVALAGVLAYEPQLLLLDEPTSHLDLRGKKELIGILKQMPQAKIIATHDIEFALEVAQTALLLDKGKIIGYGPLAEILRAHSQNL